MEDTPKIIKAREFAIARHNATGCEYDGKPYQVHLEQVVAWGQRFMDTVAGDFRKENLMCALWLHDVIEDCRVTYGDLQKEFGTIVADLVYAVTNECGKTRKERALRTYPKIAQDCDAVFVKCCDRGANIEYSASVDSSMYGKYLQEYMLFQYVLRGGAYYDLWVALDKLHGYPTPKV